MIVPGFGEERNEHVRLVLSKVDAVPNCCLIRAVGQIDTSNSTYFQRQCELCISFGFPNIIFDLGGLNYVSSTGIGAFTFLLKSAKDKKGDLVLLHIQQKVFEVFQLLGFNQFFTIPANMDEAISHFLPKEEAEFVDETPIFPKVFSCPFCRKTLKAAKEGRYRCSSCRSIIRLTPLGEVLIG